MNDMTWRTLAAGDYRVRIVWDDDPTDPLSNWEHGVTVIPLDLPRFTREDYYTSNDHTREAEVMRELLERMEREPLDFATTEERAEESEEFGTGGGINDLEDVADVFRRLTGRDLTVRQLTGIDQGDWATVAAWAMEADAPDTLVDGVLDTVETYMRGEVYGLITERRDTFANVNDEDDTLEMWRSVGSCWGYEGDDHATSEAREILEHHASGAVITED